MLLYFLTILSIYLSLWLTVHINHTAFHTRIKMIFLSFFSSFDTIYDSPLCLFLVYFKLYSSFIIWNSSGFPDNDPSVGLFFSLWCYRCSSLCGGGLTPLTMMQITYLSGWLAFAAFPHEMLLLPGSLYGVSIQGWLTLYVCTRV